MADAEDLGLAWFLTKLELLIALDISLCPDLQVKSGDFVVIVGDVGSGKSTLLQALLGETNKVGLRHRAFDAEPDRRRRVQRGR